MEHYEIPEFLIFGPERLTLEYLHDLEGARTARTLLIEGPPLGFVTFANVLCFLLNDLVDPIELSALSFIDSADGIQLKIFPEIQNEPQRPYGRINQMDAGTFEWHVSEDTLVEVACRVHALGYVNSHAHIENDGFPDEIGIVCNAVPWPPSQTIIGANGT